MIEPEAVIDSEAVAPAPASGRRRQAVVAGVTLLALLAGGIAVAGGGGRSEPKPLALMAGSGAGRGTETMAARSDGATVAPAALGAPGDSRAAMYPSGGWGLKFEVEGQLPDLPDRAAAWRVNGPALGRATIARVAEALGLTGDPVERDGLWLVDDGDRTLNANGDPSGRRGPWSINLYRSPGGVPSTVTPDDTPAGPALSKADAERRVRDLLDRMGAPAATWRVETTETEIGVGWACAAPAPAINPQELTKLEADKLRQLEQPTSAPNSAGAALVGPTPADAALIGPTPADKPAPDGNVASCPPPPPPVKGFNVALFPVLDGRRVDWPVWNVTLRSDGRLESLSGSWVTFERAGDYKLRGVDAALKDLQSPPVAYATDLPAAIEPAVGRPDETPVCPPVAMPLPAEDDTVGKSVPSMPVTCAPPAPQVVKITGVELGLMQTSMFEDGQVRLALVPSYRFTGHFDNGSPWETSVIALHPDAIAPPPNFPVGDDVRSGGGGGATGTGVGKAVPPTPPAEPAVVRE